MDKKIREIIGARRGIPAVITMDSPCQHIHKGDKVIAYLAKEFELGGQKGCWVKDFDVLNPDGTMSLGVAEGQLEFC